MTGYFFLEKIHIEMLKVVLLLAHDKVRGVHSMPTNNFKFPTNLLLQKLLQKNKHKIVTNPVICV